MGSRSLHVLGTCAGPSTRRAGTPRSSRFLAAPITFKVIGATSSKLRPLQSLTDADGRCPPSQGGGQAAPLRGSWLLQHSPPGESTHLGFASPEYVPSPGFRTLLTAFSSPDYPALFRAGALMEFHSLQSFNPRPELRSPLDDPLPSCRSRLRVPAAPDGVASTAAAGGPCGAGLLA